MNETFGKSVKRLLLLVLLYIATLVIGVVLGSVFDNIDITKWTMVIGFMLIAVLFFGKSYVNLSFGRIERRMVWPAIGMSVLMAVAQLLVTISVLSLFDVDFFYQGEELERRQQLHSSHHPYCQQLTHWHRFNQSNGYFLPDSPYRRHCFAGLRPLVVLEKCEKM